MSFNGLERVSPPEITHLTEDRSFFFNLLFFNRASNKVGTPTIKLGLYFFIIEPNTSSVTLKV